MKKKETSSPHLLGQRAQSTTLKTKGDNFCVIEINEREREI